jgi:hypothetical protein
MIHASLLVFKMCEQGFGLLFEVGDLIELIFYYI